MSKERILEYLALNKEEDKLKLKLVLHSAPLLKGIKRSCILVIASGDLHIVQREFRGTQIECVVLHRCEGKDIIMLFRRKELDTYFQEDEVSSFLQLYGYEGNSLDEYLPLLKLRVACFYQRGGQFPHEIGAFLGYPIQDVEGFIKNAGQNFLLSGYWKVYSDLQRAVELFRQYDEAKDRAAGELLAGKSLCEIAA